MVASPVTYGQNVRLDHLAIEMIRKRLGLLVATTPAWLGCIIVFDIVILGLLDT